MNKDETTLDKIYPNAHIAVMPDKLANSHETPLDEKCPKEAIIVWLGDDHEKNLTELYRRKGILKGIGWYWLEDILFPRGPFETSKDAYEDYKSYVTEK